MADVEKASTWANLLREMKGPLVEALRWKTVLLAEVKRDKNPRRWQGKQITIPIILNPQQGTAMITEVGTLANPHLLDTTQANITSAIISHPVYFSTQVIEQAKNNDTSWAEVVPTKMRHAEDGISRTMNEQMVGSGNALLANVASNTGSPGLTVPVTAATANRYQLYAGRIVDVLTRSNGANPGNGAGRKIASTDFTASPPTVTFSTSSFGGDSGNITFSSNEGLYIESSYGNALQGVGQAVATSGTFQGIIKANVPAWQGVDASPSAAADPTISVFDKAERQAYQVSGSTPDFYLVDPAVIDKYTQGLTVQARWNGDQAQLESGFTGVSYRNKVLVPEFDMPPSTAYGISREDCALYTLDDGPDWDDKTGSIMQRFGTRSLPLEAWLIWMVQFGFLSCNHFVKIGNLNQAA